MSSKEERGLKSLINGTAWMTFAVLGYTIYNLIAYRRPAMAGSWPSIARASLIIGILLTVYSTLNSFIGLRTKFSEYHKPALSGKLILILTILAIAISEIIAFFLAKQTFTQAEVLLPVIILWGGLETAVVEKFYEIGGFTKRQTAKASRLTIGTCAFGIICALFYPVVNVSLSYWMLMVPLLLMVIVMLIINNILMSV